MEASKANEITNWPRRTFRVADLMLDPENPRTADPRLSNESPISRMLQVDGESCMDLLNDIVSEGRLNPMENIIVTQDGDDVIVLEGNRRLTCLKAWASPSEIPTGTVKLENYRRQVELVKRSSAYAPIEEVSVVVAPDRESAQRWIALKHGSDQGGRGVRKWTAMMKEYAQKKENPSKCPVTLAYVEFLFESFPDSDELFEKLDLALKKYSNLQRIIRKTFTHKYLGFAYSDGRIEPLFPLEFLFPVNLHLLTDQSQDHAPSGESWSRKLNTNGDVESYFREFESLWPEKNAKQTNPSHADSAARPSEATKEADDSSDQGEPRPKSQSQSSQAELELDYGEDFPRRKKASPRSIKVLQNTHLNNFPPRLEFLAGEIAKLNLAKFPELGAVSLRVLLDLCLQHFSTNFPDVVKENAPIWEKTRSAIEFLDPDCAHSSNKVQKWNKQQELYNRCNQDNMKVIQLGVHSTQMPNTASEAKEWFDRIDPLLVAMNEKLGNNTES